MMEAGHYIQLIIAIGLVIFAFIGSYALPLRIIFPAILIIAPFEIIDSRYGTSSTGLIYLVGLSLFLRSGIKYFPLLGAVLGIILVYFMSLSMAAVNKFDHILYIIRIIPGFILFYIAYNYVRDAKDSAGFFSVLLVINIFIIIICTIQLVAGSQSVALFGIKEFSIMANRESQGRLSGPFGAEFTSEYLALANLLLAYLIINKQLIARWSTWVLWVMLSVNLGFMVATGSRGGILILVLGIFWGGYLFRYQLGTARLVKYLIGAMLTASLMTVIVIQFTNFNVLINRIESTEVKSGILDTRSVTWPVAWEAIKERPILGYGPRLRLENDMLLRIPGHKAIRYPHSLPLFLLYTLGIFGLIAYVLFFTHLLIRLYSGAKGKADKEMSGASMLGFIILAMFLLDEIKIEFLRFMQSDYQSIIFILFGGFLAMADRARITTTNTVATRKSNSRLLNLKNT